MPEEQLHGAQVLGAPVDQRCLSPAHRFDAAPIRQEARRLGSSFELAVAVAIVWSDLCRAVCVRTFEVLSVSGVCRGLAYVCEGPAVSRRVEEEQSFNLAGKRHVPPAATAAPAMSAVTLIPAAGGEPECVQGRPQCARDR